MKKFVVAAFCLILFANDSYSQKKKSIKDSTTVIIFNKPSTARSENKHGKSSENNVIKIAPLGLLSGTFPILYERLITDFFSVQVGAGLTNRNYVRNAFQKDFNEESSSKTSFTNGVTSDYSERVYGFEFRTPKMGSMFTIQPRLYFASEGLDGSYLGLSLDSYKYNFEIPGLKGNSSNYTQTGATQSENEKITDFMVHFGYQNLFDRLSFEWSTAVGIRNVTGTKYAADFNSSGNLREGVATYKQTLLNFNIGLKVGYHF